MPGISTAITATAPQTRTARSSGLLKLTATELKLLSRERVRAGLPVAIPLILLYVLSIFSCRYVERQRAKREAEEEAETSGGDDPPAA